MAEKLLAVLNKRKERGASMLEYALLAALIAVVCIVAIRTLGQEATSTFNNVTNAMKAAN